MLKNQQPVLEKIYNYLRNELGDGLLWVWEVKIELQLQLLVN